MNDSAKQLLIALLLIGAGLISPSNGVDDKMDRDLLQMLTRTVIIIIAALAIFLLYKRVFEQKKLTRTKTK